MIHIAILNCPFKLFCSFVGGIVLKSSYSKTADRTVRLAEWIIGDSCVVDPTRPTTVTAGSDHYFRTCYPSVRPSVRSSVRPHFSKVISTGRTVEMAEWIIDDTCLVTLYIKLTMASVAFFVMPTSTPFNGRLRKSFSLTNQLGMLTFNNADRLGAF